MFTSKKRFILLGNWKAATWVIIISYIDAYFVVLSPFSLSMGIIKEILDRQWSNTRTYHIMIWHLKLHFFHPLILICLQKHIIYWVLFEEKHSTWKKLDIIKIASCFGIYFLSWLNIDILQNMLPTI